MVASYRDRTRKLDDLHTGFPGKPVVISEYGYCACTEDRPEGDEHRIDVLRSHDAAPLQGFRGWRHFLLLQRLPYACRRSRCGRAEATCSRRCGSLRSAKASYEVLRRESSPVESLTAENHLNAFQLRLKTRHDVPMYTLRGYKLRGIFYGEGDIPVERQEVELPEIASGGETTVDLTFSQSGVPLHVKFDVLRPTGYSAYSGNWKP